MRDSCSVYSHGSGSDVVTAVTCWYGVASLPRLIVRELTLFAAALSLLFFFSVSAAFAALCSILCCCYFVH